MVPDIPITQKMLDAVERELISVVDMTSSQDGGNELHKMLTYHMGWHNIGAESNKGGKRIRPLLVLLSVGANGSDWKNALSAGAAVELIHNFSLIHDDIQDHSSLRRGRPTVWKIWGIPQAINAGDSMFTLGQIALLHLEAKTSPSITLAASRILQSTCQELTAGQFLDIAYETRPDMDLETYWKMIAGKTAALLATSTELGALIAQTGIRIQKAYRSFGFHLGLAFQIQDDYLGLWGNPETTGKSIQSDLISGKKTLPIIYGLSKKGGFAERWKKGSIKPEEAASLVAQLELEGARDYNYQQGKAMMDKALAALESTKPRGEAGEALINLANNLLSRKM